MASKKATKKGNSKSPRNNSNKKTETTEVTVVEKERKTNPNGVNQYTDPDPRQALFLQLYFDHQSPTWGNAKQSALAAGYGESMANQITYLRPQWFVEFCRQNSLIDKIENHFAEVMNLPNVTQAMGAFGPIEKKQVIVEETGEVYKSGKRKGQAKTKKKTVKVPVYVPNVAIIKAKNEVAKIAAPAHDPDRYGKKANTNNFIFNMTGDREKYAWNTGNL